MSLTSPTPRRRTGLAALLAVVVVALAACGSSGSDGGSDGGGSEEAGATTTSAVEDAPIQVLVSNDDAYDAPGIDALVEALREVDGVEVTVVAPLVERSGQGAESIDGEVAITDVETRSGYPAKAVDGYPIDVMEAAFGELGLEPDVVITGINSAQNVSEGIAVSGTVAAARSAAAEGVPALATSAGRGSVPEVTDYEAAIPFVLDWLEEHRAAIEDGTAEAEVTNLNVPTCETGGEVRGLVEVPLAAEDDPAYPDRLAAQDCTSTTPEAELTNDVVALNAGFATTTALT